MIGGGVVGLACAWELAREGAEVVVLERAKVGAGVSSGNAGWVCPTLSSPLPAPGMVREGLHQIALRLVNLVKHVVGPVLLCSAI